MAQFTARLLADSDRPQWDALWSRSRCLLALHWDYLTAAAAGAGTPVRVGVWAEDGRLAAGVPFVSRRRRLIAQWLHPAPAPCAGLLHERGSLTESALRDLLVPLSELIEKSVPVAETIFHPEITDVRGLLWNGWYARPHYNYTNRIEDNVLMEAAENAARRQGKKAAETHEVLFGSNHLPALFALWETTRRRQGIPAYVTRECYEKLVQQFEASETAGIRCFVAIVAEKTSGEPTAGGIFVRDAERLYYLLGASAAGEAAGTGAPSLMHFAVTEKVREETGPFVYDWVGANTPSIAQFKKKFRPDLEMSLRVTWRRGMLREWM